MSILLLCCSRFDFRYVNYVHLNDGLCLLAVVISYSDCTVIKHSGVYENSSNFCVLVLLHFV